LLQDEAYQRSLQERLVNGTAPHMETLLHHYAYGKPKDAIDLQITDLSTLTDDELRMRTAALLARLEGRDAE
jgi:hypothetical protein